jgi:hypothetical protein
VVTETIFRHLARDSFVIRVVWRVVCRYLRFSDQHRIINGLLPVVVLGSDQLWSDHLIDSGDMRLVVLILW